MTVTNEIVSPQARQELTKATNRVPKSVFIRVPSVAKNLYVLTPMPAHPPPDLFFPPIFVPLFIHVLCKNAKLSMTAPK
jgi:hypothetical protein